MPLTHTTLIRLSFSLVIALSLSACGGGGGGNDNGTAETENTTVVNTRLRQLIANNNITADPTVGRSLPSINDPLAQLGKKLFFSKSLGGGLDSSCASCHHPTLGGGDDLSLSIGVDADNPAHLGLGRTNNGDTFPVPRNAPTTFNIALWDRGLFWDSRVEALSPEPNQNGASGGIRTPDSSFGVADANAGSNLVEAQARFPVTSNEEMKTTAFENGSNNSTIRDHLAARVGNYGVGAGELTTNNWLSEFQTAFVSSDTAQNLINFSNISKAIGEYERSQVFVNNPWKAYVEGDEDAISDTAKSGAELFFAPLNEGGAGCVACHSGPLFSDEQFHTIAFPQIGPGKGDGTTNDDDFGRARETGNINDRYRFRTPTLLNVEVTAPYSHAGAYNTLEDVVRHYVNPQGAVNNYFNTNAWCNLPQFSGVANCTSLFSNAETNTRNALTQLDQQRRAGNSRLPNIRLNGDQVTQLVEFLKTLTDPCVKDRSCLADWIPDNNGGPDNQQLNAVDAASNLL